MAVDREMLEAIGQLMDTKLEPVYQRMDSMQNEMKTMQGEMKTMQGEMKTMQGEIAGIKQKQEEQIQYARETRILLEDTNRKIQTLAEGHGDTVSRLRKLDCMEKTLSDVKSDVEVIKTVVSWHSEDIQQLKKA